MIMLSEPSFLYALKSANFPDNRLICVIENQNSTSDQHENGVDVSYIELHRINLENMIKVVW